VSDDVAAAGLDTHDDDDANVMAVFTAAGRRRWPANALRANANTSNSTPPPSPDDDNPRTRRRFHSHEPR